MNEDPIQIFSADRPLSWSSVSSFEYDPRQWFDKYILGNRSPDTRESLFGKSIGEKLVADPAFLPQVPRRSIFEHGIRATVADLPIIGYLDTYEPKVAFDEYKTGKKPWDQQRVDEHGQLTMYFLLLYLSEGLVPDEIECHLHWLPTKDTGDFNIDFVDAKDVRSFRTYRTLRQLVDFGTYLHKKHSEMQRYAERALSGTPVTMAP